MFVQWLPTLFKKNSNGGHQEWSIGTCGNVIVTKWGQIGGAIQETRDEIKSGKNIGRANATTAEEQALAEATSKWEKQLKKGYVQSLDSAKEGKTDDIIEGGIFPMLAHRFDKHGHKLVYPCYEQPKLDGHRCIAMIDAEGNCTLWSRTRKPITSMTHIVEAIRNLGMPNTIFDGELYNHDYKDRFEELTSFIRNREFKTGAEEVQYHIYDMPSSWGFHNRWGFLRGHLDLKIQATSPLRIVETRLVNNRDELMTNFEHFLEQGYEGAIARNVSGQYVNERSYDLLKIKEFDEDEFPVIRVEEGRGKLTGHAVFVCKTKTGVEFGAKLKGKQENLKQYFDRPELAIGRQLTVEFKGYTNKNGAPRFPVALRFREDI